MTTWTNRKDVILREIRHRRTNTARCPFYEESQLARPTGGQDDVTPIPLNMVQNASKMCLSAAVDVLAVIVDISLRSCEMLHLVLTSTMSSVSLQKH